MAATKKIRSHRELEVYQVGFEAAMKIFEVTRHFPREETYSLTDQIRRSSRGVCSNIAEAWRRRRYEGAFVNCLNTSEAEGQRLKPGSSSPSNVATSTVRLAANCMLITTKSWASLSS